MTIIYTLIAVCMAVCIAMNFVMYKEIKLMSDRMLEYIIRMKAKESGIVMSKPEQSGTKHISLSQKQNKAMDLQRRD